MKYPPYSKKELWDIIFNPRKISADPYKLFVAFALERLYITFIFEDEREVKTKQEIFYNIANSKFIDEDIDRGFNYCLDDFIECVKNKWPLELQNGSFTIRNAKNVTREKLKEIFDFKTDHNGDRRLTEDSILDVTKPPIPETMSEQKRITAANRKRAMEIFYIGRTNEGWRSFVDMEKALYTWLLYYKKHQDEQISQKHVDEWFEKYNDYFNMSMKSVLKLLEKGLEIPKNAFSFSAEKLNFARREWAEEPDFNGYDIDMKEAEDYWYSNFK